MDSSNSSIDNVLEEVQNRGADFILIHSFINVCHDLSRGIFKMATHSDNQTSRNYHD